jgi:hypothetical protein
LIMITVSTKKYDKCPGVLILCRIDPAFLAVPGLDTFSIYSSCLLSTQTHQIIFRSGIYGRTWGFKPLEFQYQQMPLTYRSASHLPYGNMLLRSSPLIRITSTLTFLIIACFHMVTVLRDCQNLSDHRPVGVAASGITTMWKHTANWLSGNDPVIKPGSVCFHMVGAENYDISTYWVKASCSSSELYSLVFEGIRWFSLHTISFSYVMEGPLGIKPRLPEPNSGVLSLHHEPVDTAALLVTATRTMGPVSQLVGQPCLNTLLWTMLCCTEPQHTGAMCSNMVVG